MLQHINIPSKSSVGEICRPEIRPLWSAVWWTTHKKSPAGANQRPWFTIHEHDSPFPLVVPSKWYSEPYCHGGSAYIMTHSHWQPYPLWVCLIPFWNCPNWWPEQHLVIVKSIVSLCQGFPKWSIGHQLLMNFIEVVHITLAKNAIQNHTASSTVHFNYQSKQKKLWSNPPNPKQFSSSPWKKRFGDHCNMWRSTSLCHFPLSPTVQIHWF